MKDIMLLESALAELSIDILDDYQPQMLLPVTTPPTQYTYSDAELEIRKTWSQLLESCSEPITTHEESENDSSTRDLEKYNVHRAPGCVPFTWEIQPGVPNSPRRQLQLRDQSDHTECKLIVDFQNILKSNRHEQGHILGSDRHELDHIMGSDKNELSHVLRSDRHKLSHIMGFNRNELGHILGSDGHGRSRHELGHIMESNKNGLSHILGSHRHGRDCIPGWNKNSLNHILESNRNEQGRILGSDQNDLNHILESDKHEQGELLYLHRDEPSPLLTVSSGTTASPASQTSTKKNAGGCFNWNLPHLSTQSLNICEGFVQGGNINGYDADDEDDIIPSILPLDSKEKWSPVSTLEIPESPGSSSSSSARLTPSFNDSHQTMPSGPAKSTSATLLWGVFPCKCILLPWLKQKGKKKQPERATGHQDRQDSNVSLTSHESIRLTSALKMKNRRSGSCNRNYCNSAAGMKQVRFNVETEACFSSGGETVPPPTQMDWASYGLF